jgi:hypothetical protein
MSYYAVNQASSVLWDAKAYWITARETYNPGMFAEFTIHTAKRSDLKLSLGTGSDGSTPTTTWSSVAFYNSGGSFGFDGVFYSNASSAPDGVFVLDFSDLNPQFEIKQRYFFGLNDTSNPDYSGTIKALALTDWNGAVLAAAANVPLSDAEGGGSIVYAYADFNTPTPQPTAAPTVTLTPTPTVTATITPSSTSTATPTNMPQPTAAPMVTSTPQPTAIPTPFRTPTATKTAVSQFAIIAEAASGGEISPSGKIMVNQGNSQTFIITPNAGFFLEDVVVDGISQGPATEYSFVEVNEEHSIKAKFATDLVAPEKPLNLQVDGKGNRSNGKLNRGQCKFLCLVHHFYQELEFLRQHDHPLVQHTYR